MNKLIKFIVFEAAMLAGLYVLKNYTEKYMDLRDEECDEECGGCCCSTEEVKAEEKVETPVETKQEEVKVEINPEIPLAPIVGEKPKRVAKPRVKKAPISEVKEVKSRAKKPVTTTVEPKAEVKDVKPKAQRVTKPRIKKTEDKKDGE